MNPDRNEREQLDTKHQTTAAAAAVGQETAGDESIASALRSLDLYNEFSAWIDGELAKLEAQYEGWGTPGYGHWRKTNGGRIAR